MKFKTRIMKRKNKETPMASGRMFSNILNCINESVYVCLNKI